MLKQSTVDLAHDLVVRMGQVKRMRELQNLEHARFIVKVADMEGVKATFKGDGDILVINACARLADSDATTASGLLAERAEAMLFERDPA